MVSCSSRPTNAVCTSMHTVFRVHEATVLNSYTTCQPLHWVRTLHAITLHWHGSMLQADFMQVLKPEFKRHHKLCSCSRHAQTAAINICSSDPLCPILAPSQQATLAHAAILPTRRCTCRAGTPWYTLSDSGWRQQSAQECPALHKFMLMPAEACKPACRDPAANNYTYWLVQSCRRHCNAHHMLLNKQHQTLHRILFGGCLPACRKITAHTTHMHTFPTRCISSQHTISFIQAAAAAAKPARCHLLRALHPY